MSQAALHRMSRRLRFLATIIFVCAIPVLSRADDTVDGRPLHQVLDEKPADLMLNYFVALAAGLPHDHAVPQTLAEWEQRKVELRSRLRESLGEFPRDDRPPLNARITGRIDHGDHVVEKVLYESLPGLYVTALVYVPKQLAGPAPAVMCVNGHWAGAKSTPLIQERCISLAKMGVIAFCQDVIGTGERQNFSGTPPTTYHGFYRGAAPLSVDRSLLGYIMYECTRGLDYLLTRDDVDPQRVMCTGASGGGKQSMFFPAARRAARRRRARLLRRLLPGAWAHRLRRRNPHRHPAILQPVGNPGAACSAAAALHQRLPRRPGIPAPAHVRRA